MAWWFRMHTEFVHDPKVQRLPGELFKFWVNCLGLTCQQDGSLPPLSDIAWKLNMRDKQVIDYVAKLNEAGLLDQDGPVIVPHNWAARQFKSDVSTERVRRFRNKHETFPKRDETVPETAPELVVKNIVETQHTNAPDGALFAISPIHKTRGKRTTEEIRKALGPRLSWWEKFWAAYPCHEGMNPAMDAFERLVTSEEIFRAVMGGAGRYAAKARADPNMKLKYGQGWLNDQRWTDEDSKAAVKQVAPTIVLPDRKWDLLGDMRRDAEARKAEEPDEETKAWYAKLDAEFMGKREVKSQ